MKHKQQAPLDAAKTTSGFWAMLWAMLAKWKQDKHVEPATPSVHPAASSAHQLDIPETSSCQHLPTGNFAETQAPQLLMPVHQQPSPPALVEGHTAGAVPAAALDTHDPAAAHAPAEGSPAGIVHRAVIGFEAMLLADAASLGTRACHECQQALDHYYTTVRNCKTCQNQRTCSATSCRQASHDAGTSQPGPEATAVSPRPSPLAPGCKARNKCGMVVPVQQFEKANSHTDGRVGTHRRSTRRKQLARLRQQGLDCPPSGHPLSPITQPGCTNPAHAQPAAANQEPAMIKGTDHAAQASAKVCLYCQQLLPLKYYYRNRSVRSGRRAECKACFAQRYRKPSQPDAPAQPPRKKARVSDAHPSSTAVAAWGTVTAARQRHQDGPFIPASKQCLRSQQVLQAAAFAADVHTRNGLDSSCQKTALKPARLPFITGNAQPAQESPSGTQGGSKCGLVLSSSVNKAAASAEGAGGIKGSKQCRRCLRLLPCTSFDADRNISDGLRSCCKGCRAEKYKQRGGTPAGHPSAMAGSSTKQCSRCRRMLSRAAFGAASRNLDGLKGECRECRSNIEKAQRAGNTLQEQASALPHGPAPVAPTLHLQQQQSPHTASTTSCKKCRRCRKGAAIPHVQPQSPEPRRAADL